MLLPSVYANAAGRLIGRAPATLAMRFPAALTTMLTRGAAGRFLIAPPTRLFSVSRRSPFAAAKVAQKTVAAKQKTTKAAPKAGTAKKGAKATTTKAKGNSKAKTAKTTKTAKSAKTKTVAASKKKAATKKAAATKKKPKKKVLTEEEKIGNDRRALRKIVLKEPHGLPDRIWPVFIAEWCKGKEGDLIGRLKGASEAYKALDSAEIEKLRSTAQRNRLSNQVAYSNWVESIPMEDIRAANRARARLTKKHNIVMHQIRDSRAPKRSCNPFTFFVKSKFQAGQASPGPATRSIKDFSREWASMPETQKQPFIELAGADSIRYKNAKKTAGM